MLPEKIARALNCTWRPTLAWLFVVAIFLQFIIHPLAPDVVVKLDLSSLLTLVAGSSGLVFLRSKDKKDGVA